MRLSSALWSAGSAVAAACNSDPSAFDASRGVTYLGLQRNGIEVFLNIPFAENTGGANRFRPPVPYSAPANSTVVAQTPGHACPQTLNALSGPNALSSVNDTSEDCLNLNIARPAGAQAGDALPVMVFIYGGGFWLGFNNDLRYAPDALVRESVANGLPVIEVNINYRLGVFGFGVSDALRVEGSTNAGLRDQRLALEWLQANVANFGGDPSRVTIFGQSSGGLAVGMQMLAYGGAREVPFQRAICESQALEPGITGNFTSDAWARVVAYAGCDGSSSEDEVACLRELDTQAMLEAAEATFQSDISDNIGDIWLPTVDDDFLPAAPSTLIRESRFAENINAIIGWCQDDLNLFTDRSISTPDDTRAFIGAYLPAMNSTTLDGLLTLYPSTDFSADVAAGLSAEFFRTARIWRDIFMVCMPQGFGAAIAAKNPESVYLFEWNQTLLEPAYASAGLPGVGVFHTSDLEYVFGDVDRYNKSAQGYPFNPSSRDYALARRGSRSWSTFATLGRPSLEGHETFVGWESASPVGKNASWRVFVAGGPHEGLSAWEGPEAIPEVATQRLSERCAFLNSEEVIAQMQF
ncbi:acetylcholinesterase [Xylaria bambusicola]|uniref:acetylcholinesterase n=1 Tax=Xylaria bambusicola TaxID=326684 RepID=UPI002007EF18|nr:acetylcholinesterase [Xylaria bambusicola]KAI0515051.1 acetylcholinesterase [Xylaria bambusicola]